MKRNEASNEDVPMPCGKFFVCVEGVYVKDGKVLLLKRSVEPFKGCWHVVGGHVEEKETLKHALKREFKEETNLDIEVGDIINGRIEKTSDRTKVIVVFEVISARGEIGLSPENEAYFWFDSFPSNSVYDRVKFTKVQKMGPIKNLTKNNKHSFR